MRQSLVVFLMVVTATPVAAQLRREYRSATQAVPLQAFQPLSSGDWAHALRGGAISPALSVATPNKRPAAIDSTPASRRTCPMPVLTPDSTRYSVAVPSAPSAAKRQAMPVVVPTCHNPLR
jgi:hypothetical protein